MSLKLSANISHYLLIINKLILESGHTEDYRRMVSAAILEGRDIAAEDSAEVVQRLANEQGEAEMKKMAKAEKSK
jgi:hypothetical protein